MSDRRQLDAPSHLPGRTIAIIGAGPARLTLARLMQMAGASVQVFERDSGLDARWQGGRAALITAYMLGFSVLRDSLGSPVIEAADASIITARLGAAIQGCLDARR